MLDDWVEPLERILWGERDAQNFEVEKLEKEFCLVEKAEDTLNTYVVPPHHKIRDFLLPDRALSAKIQRTGTIGA